MADEQDPTDAWVRRWTRRSEVLRLLRARAEQLETQIIAALSEQVQSQERYEFHSDGLDSADRLFRKASKFRLEKAAARLDPLFEELAGIEHAIERKMQFWWRILPIGIAVFAAIASAWSAYYAMKRYDAVEAKQLTHVQVK